MATHVKVRQTNKPEVMFSINKNYSSLLLPLPEVFIALAESRDSLIYSAGANCVFLFFPVLRGAVKNDATPFSLNNTILLALRLLPEPLISNGYTISRTLHIYISVPLKVRPLGFRSTETLLHRNGEEMLKCKSGLKNKRFPDPHP